MVGSGISDFCQCPMAHRSRIDVRKGAIMSYEFLNSSESSRRRRLALADAMVSGREVPPRWTARWICGICASPPLYIYGANRSVRWLTSGFRISASPTAPLCLESMSARGRFCVPNPPIAKFTREFFLSNPHVGRRYGVARKGSSQGSAVGYMGNANPDSGPPTHTPL